MKHILVVCAALVVLGGAYRLLYAEEPKAAPQKWEFRVGMIYNGEPEGGFYEVLKKGADKNNMVLLSGWNDLAKMGADGWDVSEMWLQDSGVMGGVTGQPMTKAPPSPMFLFRRPAK